MITQSELKELLHYDPETGIFTLLQSRGNKKIGSEAGTIKLGYVQIQINNKKYFAHRLAWLYVHGKWPENSIDHINRKRDDNRISNLREATLRQNNLNVSGRNKKYIGVLKDQYSWRAFCSIHNKTIYMGRYKDEEKAARCRDAYIWLHCSDEDKKFVTWNFPDDLEQSVKIYLELEKVDVGYQKRPSGSYRANIQQQYKKYYLGTYKTKDEARRAYDVVAVYLGKEKINFPNLVKEYKSIIENSDSKNLKELARKAAEL